MASRTPRTVLHVCVEEGGFHVCSKHSATFTSEDCRKREQHSHSCCHYCAGVPVLHILLKASQHVSFFARFQHPLATDDLFVGVVLVHLGVEPLVFDALQLCSHGDCFGLNWWFVVLLPVSDGESCLQCQVLDRLPAWHP